MGRVIRVLVVDDEPMLVRSLQRFLRREGFEVVTAEHGLAALAVLEQAPVDVVLSDVRMPEMDGPTLLDRIRARWVPPPPVILLTGYADASDGELVRRGAHAVLGKPIEPVVLVTLLRQVLPEA